MISSTSTQHREYLRKRRNKKILKYVLIILILFFVVGFLSYISHRSQIRISKVEFSGQVLVNQSDVKEKTFDFLNGSYLWLFPKNNVFLYPNKDLKKYLTNQFKRIETINIHLKDFRTLSIEITERKLFALWCDNATRQSQTSIVEDGSITEQCYFMDNTGTIFAEAPNFSGDAYFKYYGLVSSDNPIGKEYLASSTEFTDIAKFVDTVRDLSLKPLYIIGKDNGQFVITLFSLGEIYFDTKEPMSKVGENLKALMRTPAFANLNNISIDYIDLRFGNKLYYKLKPNY